MQFCNVNKKFWENQQSYSNSIMREIKYALDRIYDLKKSRSKKDKQEINVLYLRIKCYTDQWKQSRIEEDKKYIDYITTVHDFYDMWEKDQPTIK